MYESDSPVHVTSKHHSTVNSIHLYMKQWHVDNALTSTMLNVSFSLFCTCVYVGL